jgi:hypothetical protein
MIRTKAVMAKAMAATMTPAVTSPAGVVRTVYFFFDTWGCAAGSLPASC